MSSHSADPEKAPLLGANGEPLEVTKQHTLPATDKHAPVQHWANFFGASTTTLIVLYYAACSSTMLVINKASTGCRS